MQHAVRLMRVNRLVLYRGCVVLLFLFIPAVLTVADEQPAEESVWELADGTEIKGVVTAVRDNMVHMKSVKGRSLIGLSRFSASSQEKIRELFPESAPLSPPATGESKDLSKSAPSVPPDASAGPAAQDETTPQNPPPHPGLRNLNVGDPAPQLRVRNFDSEETITLDSLRGRVVLVVFWNSSEQQALRDVQYLTVAHEVIPPEVVTIVGVSVDPRYRQYKSTAKQLGATWPSHHDPNRTVLRHWGVTAVPTTVVIDQNGNIFKEHVYAAQLPELLQEMNIIPPQ